MDTLNASLAEHVRDAGRARADMPHCENCDSKQVQLGVTTQNLEHTNGFASQSVVAGQWFHCLRCDHRWFQPTDLIQEAEDYLLTLEDDRSQNVEIRKMAKILRLLSDRVRINDAIVAQFMQERP